MRYIEKTAADVIVEVSPVQTRESSSHSRHGGCGPLVRERVLLECWRLPSH